MLGIGDTVDDDLERSSYVGVVVAIAGNLCISIALNVQKHVHNHLARLKSNQSMHFSVSSSSEMLRANRNGRSFGATGRVSSTQLAAQDASQDSPIPPMTPESTFGDDGTHAETSYVNVPTWWLGMGLMLLGELGNFAAYGFAPAVLVAPLGTIALISNAIIAPLFLGESFRMRDFLGILFATFGTVIIVVTEEPVLSPGDIVEAIIQPQFIVYTIIMAAVAIALSYTSAKSSLSSRFILIDIELVAIFGGFTVLSTKALSSLMNTNFLSIVTYPITYLMLFVLVSTALLQVRYLNHALARFDSTEVIPTDFVLFTISTIVRSALLYPDFNRMTEFAIASCLFGVSCMFGGVFLITGQRHSDEVGSKLRRRSARGSDVLIDHHSNRSSEDAPFLGDLAEFEEPAEGDNVGIIGLGFGVDQMNDLRRLGRGARVSFSLSPATAINIGWDEDVLRSRASNLALSSSAGSGHTSRNVLFGQIIRNYVDAHETPPPRSTPPHSSSVLSDHDA
ncbi:magnesium transporter NIPA-domain-containing protein [Cladochytrium replicatum]|nr:magnesium transporter NIPA-domain-containing protein [Cladochytrium replicatum]